MAILWSRILLRRSTCKHGRRQANSGKLTRGIGYITEASLTSPIPSGAEARGGLRLVAPSVGGGERTARLAELSLSQPRCVRKSPHDRRLAASPGVWYGRSRTRVASSRDGQVILDCGWSLRQPSVSQSINVWAGGPQSVGHIRPTPPPAPLVSANQGDCLMVATQQPWGE